MLQSIIQGLLMGGVFALAGVGMSMIFGIVKLTNLAHGEMLILAAYFSNVICSATGMHPLVSMVIVAPVMFGIGYLLQRTLINRVLGPGKGDEPAMLVTFGLSVILQNLMQHVFSMNPTKLKVGYAIKSIVLSEDAIIPVIYLVNFVYMDRPEGDTLIRGIRKVPTINAFRTRISLATKDAYESGKTKLRLSYHKVWLSGLFYRMYERESAGIPVDFYEAAERFTAGKTYNFSKTRNTFEAKKRQVAREFMQDYRRWKVSFNL